VPFNINDMTHCRLAKSERPTGQLGLKETCQKQVSLQLKEVGTPVLIAGLTFLAYLPCVLDSFHPFKKLR
jgi:hypothetical protein